MVLKTVFARADARQRQPRRHDPEAEHGRRRQEVAEAGLAAGSRREDRAAAQGAAFPPRAGHRLPLRRPVATRRRPSTSRLMNAHRRAAVAADLLLRPRAAGGGDQGVGRQAGERRAPARRAFLHRARMNSLAATGAWTATARKKPHSTQNSLNAVAIRTRRPAVDVGRHCAGNEVGGQPVGRRGACAMANDIASRCRLCLVTPAGVDAETFAAAVDDALAGGDVASLIITGASGRSGLPAEGGRGASCRSPRTPTSPRIVHNDTRIAGRTRADGVHIDTGPADLAARRRRLPAASAWSAPADLTSRHDAMAAGEADARLPLLRPPRRRHRRRHLPQGAGPRRLVVVGHRHPGDGHGRPHARLGRRSGRERDRVRRPLPTPSGTIRAGPRAAVAEADERSGREPGGGA